MKCASYQSFHREAVDSYRLLGLASRSGAFYAFDSSFVFSRCFGSDRHGGPDFTQILMSSERQLVRLRSRRLEKVSWYVVQRRNPNSVLGQDFEARKTARHVCAFCVLESSSVYLSNCARSGRHFWQALTFYV